MQHTLVAMFENNGSAESAQHALLAAGFFNAQVFREQAGIVQPAAAAPRKRKSGAKPRVALAGTLCVLTLLLVDELELARAASIVERYAPGDIDGALAERFMSLNPDSLL